MEWVHLSDLGLEHSDNFVSVLFTQEPHARSAEDVERGVLVVGDWDMLHGIVQQRLQRSEGCLGAAGECGYT